MSLWVKSGNTQPEHMMSAPPPKADIGVYEYECQLGSVCCCRRYLFLLVINTSVRMFSSALLSTRRRYCYGYEGKDNKTQRMDQGSPCGVAEAFQGEDASR